MDLVVKYRRSVATILSMVAIFLFSCSEKHEVVEVVERSISPRLHALDVATLVSDSGITRYRVNAKEWLVFDKKAKPTWEFPQGIHLEQFDENFEIHSEVDAKKAIYYTELEEWVLSDSVYAVNNEGEKFESEILYVHQKEDRIFTDKFVKIVSQFEMRTNPIGKAGN